METAGSSDTPETMYTVSYNFTFYRSANFNNMIVHLFCSQIQLNSTSLIFPVMSLISVLNTKNKNQNNL